MVSLGAIDDGDDAGVHPNALNVHGQVVGHELTADDPYSETYAFSWTPTGGIINLGTLGGFQAFANAVNAAGEVVGSCRTGDGVFPDGVFHAFVWTAGRGMIDLGTLAGFVHSRARAITDNGVIVGNSITATGVRHATMWPLAGSALRSVVNPGR